MKEKEDTKFNVLVTTFKIRYVYICALQKAGTTDIKALNSVDTFYFEAIMGNFYLPVFSSSSPSPHPPPPPSPSSSSFFFF